MGTGASRQQIGGMAADNAVTIHPSGQAVVSDVPASAAAAAFGQYGANNNNNNSSSAVREETIVIVAGGGGDDPSPLGAAAGTSAGCGALLPIPTDIVSNPADARFLEDELPAKYLKKDLLGKGAFGEAFLVERVSDHRTFVGKVMDLHLMTNQDKKYAQTEVLCLAHSKHFAVIQYVEHQVIDEDTVVIVMEYADNGDLYNNIRRRRASFTEKEAGMFYVQLLLALDHLHRRRMIHRDIKSANVFMTQSGLIKLGDFGFSQQYEGTVSGDCAATFLGTPYYLAPEMWQGKRYGKTADVWASAIVFFEFLTGGRPFVGGTMPALKKAVLEGEYAMPPTASPEVQSFLRYALTQDPQRRPSAQALLATPLMQGFVADLSAHVAKSPLIDEATRNLVAFNIAESMNAAREALAAGRITTGPSAGSDTKGEEASLTRATSGKAVRHEGRVFKESGMGVWKERYLILENSHLTLALAKGGKDGSDKSKRIPTDNLVSVVAVAENVVTADGSVRYAFAIGTIASSAIVFATGTPAERDMWVQRMQEVLEIA